MATCCVPRVLRSGSCELLDAEARHSRACQAGEAARARAAANSTFEHVTFHYPTRPRNIGAQRFQPRRQAARAARGRWAVGRRQDDASSSSPSAFTIRRTGRVLLDGVDLRDADPADVRQRIAMVPQDTVMFAASARDNLRYGNWNASEDAAVAGRARRECRGVPPLSSGRPRYLSWAKAARGFRAGSVSASPSPARCCAMPLCYCSTKRPPRSMRKANDWCRTRSTA